MSAAEENYCAYCGVDLDGNSLRRFGAPFCTEEHAALYGQELRARQMAVATTDGGAPEAGGTPERQPGAGGAEGRACASKKGLKGWLLKAACCGGGLLILAMLPLVAPAIGAIGSSLLTILAFAACPLSMYLMMRMMGRGMQHEGQAGQKAGTDQVAAGASPIGEKTATTGVGPGAASVPPNLGSSQDGQHPGAGRPA